jgi:divalent metal cation (Fe/Co/Zn/Cd) transporter
LLLSGLLLFSAYRVITGSFFDLLDHRLEESLQFIILAEVAAQLHEIAELHGIRSRRSGSSVYIEIFLEFDGRRPMAEVQTVINRMKEGLEQQIQGSHVTIVPATARVI